MKTMRIGIATFHQSDNYGAVLQAYALQTFLKTCGHDVHILDFRPKLQDSWLRHWVSKSPKGCLLKWEQQWSRRYFEKFRRNYLCLTPKTFKSIEELEKIAEYFDLLIAGSDQIWNPRWLDQTISSWNFFFLRFAEGKCRRISYAASLGHSDLSTLSEEWKNKLSDGIKTFDAISVRELSGVKLVYEISGRSDAVFLPDPTFLLNKLHYDQLVGVFETRAPYLFSFMLHGLMQDAEAICRLIADELNLRILRCDMMKTCLHKGYIYPSPQNWLKIIRAADYVVTNSFHCTIFCLIFHIPFISLLIKGPLGSMNSRIIELLDLFSLKERMLYPGEVINKELITSHIDWTMVDRKIGSLKANAKKFLEQHLSDSSSKCNR